MYTINILSRAAAAALAVCVLTVGLIAKADDSFPPVPTPFTTVTAPADPDHFSFIVAGDNRSTGHGIPMPDVCNEICREIGVIHPPFVLWTGDCIYGYGDTVDEANAEYDVFQKALDLTGVPVFNCPGNHEFSLDPKLLPVYLKRMGKLYGSFDYGNSHFIALNTNAINADGTITAGTLDPDQWTWLENDLKAHQNAANIFVYMHHYPFGPPDPDSPKIDSGWITAADRDRLHAMMVQYHVRAVIAGHNHIFYHMQKDGVDYFISGGAGAPLDASPEQGGYLHFIAMHVDGDKLTYDVLVPDRLRVTYPGADDGSTATETAWVTNENHTPVTVDHVVFHVKAPAAGQTLAVTAGVAAKGGGKPKPVDAKILSSTPSADGSTVEVVVETTAKNAKTTTVTVGPQ